ncbi:branched-chain amino acid ABC transporter permease [Variovorax ginsengisoli]|uniref:Branched-chain amino acid transport system permease protein n=1 Tax=Variovorax ginsengisoli TaxID=363844 RepID=A0ABT9S987_9BURK|nr:branched-chain amino acid ABC transporter permease [Variovorax ginsengisoli]MDP9900923.1 branched-chain amino acid transport system permease protein [Variovorax ginsengisoli]
MAAISPTAEEPSTAPPALEALPGRTRDMVPGILILAFIAIALPIVGSVPTWVTLTVAALAMGMMLFIMASGLTLVFGLMDVMNLGHAAFVAVGAYTATLLVGPLQPLLASGSVWAALAAIVAVIALSMWVTAVLGWVYERLFVKPVYGDHLKQILITIGAMIIIEQLVLVLFGANQMLLPLPEAVRGSFVFGDIAVERYRLVAVAVGVLVFIGLTLMLNRTRIGLLIRAGVENRSMVEALGYRVRGIFVGVFVAGSALAGLGGVMWAFYREQFTVAIGAEVLVQMLIIVIIGGLGSVTGCFVGAMLIALCTNYVSFLLPDLALVSNILVMMVVLLWRPQGLYPIDKH